MRQPNLCPGAAVALRKGTGRATVSMDTVVTGQGRSEEGAAPPIAPLGGPECLEEVLGLSPAPQPLFPYLGSARCAMCAEKAHCQAFWPQSGWRVGLDWPDELMQLPSGWPLPSRPC